MQHDISWFFNSKIDDLKSKGNLVELTKLLNSWLPSEVNTSKFTLDDILTIHRTFKNSFKKRDKEKSNNEKELTYFKTEEDQVIFYLVELSGETRQKKLDITPIHFKSLDKSKKWRDNLIKIVHPDKCKHKNATKASKIINTLYSEMQKDAK